MLEGLGILVSGFAASVAITLLDFPILIVPLTLFACIGVGVVIAKLAKE